MNNDHIINCPCCDHQMMVDYQSESLMSFFCANVECDINKHTAYRFPFTYSDICVLLYTPQTCVHEPITGVNCGVLE